MYNIFKYEKTLVIIINLFIVISLSTSFSAGNIKSSIKDSNNIFDSQKTVNLSVMYFTLDGLSVVDKNVLKEDAESLFQLINTSDFDLISIKMDSLDLIPEDMSIDDITTLLNGDYGRSAFKEYEDSFENIDYDYFNNKADINCLNSVFGEARDHYFLPFSMVSMYGLGLFFLTIESFLSQFPWYDFDYGLGLFGIIGLILAGFSLEGYYLINMIHPIKISRCAWALLEDGAKKVPAKVNTVGLLGSKTFSGFSIDLVMLGFTGVWAIDKDDHLNSPGCKFMGYSMLTFVL